MIDGTTAARAMPLLRLNWPAPRRALPVWPAAGARDGEQHVHPRPTSAWNVTPGSHGHCSLDLFAVAQPEQQQKCTGKARVFLLDSPPAAARTAFGRDEQGTGSPLSPTSPCRLFVLPSAAGMRSPDSALSRGNQSPSEPRSSAIWHGSCYKRGRLLTAPTGCVGQRGGMACRSSCPGRCRVP